MDYFAYRRLDMKNKYTSIRLEITSKCNLNCAYCHNEKNLNSCNDMLNDDIKKMITIINNNNNINKILLTGGEPLMNTGVVELVRYITSFGIKTDMVTNGLLLSDKMIKSLNEAGLKRIRLSIDDTSSKNKNRSNINSQFVLNKIERVLTLSNIEVCIHTVVTLDNVDNLYDLYKVVLNSGAKRWRVFDIGFQGGMTNNMLNFDIIEYYKKLVNSSKKIIDDYIKNGYDQYLDIEINNVFKTSFLNMKIEDYSTFDFMMEYNKIINLSPCNYVTNHQITIRSDGKVTLCQYFRNPSLYFEKGKMHESKKTPQEFILTLKDIEKCKNCRHLLNCKSGCRSRALFFTGDIFNPDPTACVLHSLVDKYIMPLLPIDTQKIYNLYINNNGNAPFYTSNDLVKLLDKKRNKNESDWI